MNIFILDKNLEDRNSLINIIKKENLGFILGEGSNILEEKSLILDTELDLLIWDPINNQDEYKVIEEIKAANKNFKFIVISNDTSKEIVEKSYKNGAEYYIYKPINDFEVKSIVSKVKKETREVEKLKEIRKTINDFLYISSNKESIDKWEKCLSSIILKLGIVGEKGTEDIVKIIKFVIDNKINISETSIREICSKLTSKPRNMEQRIRRAINVAMVNVANLGIEDYMNDIFVEYSNTLFNFQQIKKEMDYIRGKSKERGHINMKKFLSGIRVVCENYSN